MAAAAPSAGGKKFSTCTGVERSVYWDESKIFMIDQKLLPSEFKVISVDSVADVIAKIKDMTVRGAPAIGAAGAFALAIAANGSSAASAAALAAELKETKARLDAARPTAVNLMWATGRVLETAEAAAALAGADRASVAAAVLHEALALAEEDVAINTAIAKHGAEIVPKGANILHHCNTGALATVDVGTALGVIYECHKQGKGIHVWVDETRPRLQGAKLTAWELMRGGVPLHLIVDSASGLLMRTGKVDVVLFGADRVAANGDVANKVGTYKMCVVARENGVPTYACVPTSTIDLTIATGDDIVIEERSGDEVTIMTEGSGSGAGAGSGAVRVAPEGVPVWNPGFDVTPAKYLTGIITEEGICYPPFAMSLRRAKEAAEARIAAQRAAKMAVVKA